VERSLQRQQTLLLEDSVVVAREELLVLYITTDFHRRFNALLGEQALTYSCVSAAQGVTDTFNRALPKVDRENQSKNLELIQHVQHLALEKLTILKAGMGSSDYNNTSPTAKTASLCR